ncbi:hypothetical protein ACTFIY_005530 [Dictyostelium cf. discoideum]
MALINGSVEEIYLIDLINKSKKEHPTEKHCRKTNGGEIPHSTNATSLVSSCDQASAAPSLDPLKSPSNSLNDHSADPKLPPLPVLKVNGSNFKPYPPCSPLVTGKTFTMNGNDFVYKDNRFIQLTGQNAYTFNEAGKYLDSPPLEPPIVKKEKLEDGSSKITQIDSVPVKTKKKSAMEKPWTGSGISKSDSGDVASSASGEPSIISISSCEDIDDEFDVDYSTNTFNKIIVVPSKYYEHGLDTRMMTLLVPKHQHLRLYEFHNDHSAHGWFSNLNKSLRKR